MNESRSYDAHQAMMLDPGEPIRRRPEMYFGGTDSEGMTLALIEALRDVLALSVGDVRVDVVGDGRVRVDASSGRLSVADGRRWLGTEFFMPNAASWWRPSVGGGAFLARHVCSCFELVTHDGEERSMVLFIDEEDAAVTRRIGATHREGFTMSMEFDRRVFDPDAAIDYGLLVGELDACALYHAGVRVRVVDERVGREEVLHWPEGLESVLEAELPGAPIFTAEARDEEEGVAVRVALAWGDSSRSWGLARVLEPDGAGSPSGPHVDGVLGGVMESLCVLSRRLEDETPLCWDARGALRGARVALWVGRCPERWAGRYAKGHWSWRNGGESEHATEGLYGLAARAVAAELPAFLNRRPELRDELLRRVLV